MRLLNHVSLTPLIQIFAVEAIRKAGLKLKGNIEQSGVVDEETTGVRNAGMGYLVENGYIQANKIDAIVITEPLNTTNVCCGRMLSCLWVPIIVLR